MARANQAATTLSTKGQVILPAEIRRRRGWSAGTRLTVEETADGVLLRQASPFPRTDPDKVFGCLRYDGPPISVEDMNAAVAAEAKRRYDRNRH